MKKILGVTVVLMFMIFVFGCKAKTSATAEFFDIERKINSIVLSVEIIDPDEEITGAITIKILRPNGGVVNSKEIQSEIDLIGITFSALDNSLQYTIEVHATVGRNSIMIGTASYTLPTAGTIYVATPEEFLNMGTNRFGNYVLSNDLDFSDIEFDSVFRSPFSGTFDGQDYTIRNINFSKITTYTGVFGYVSSGNIRNLTLENINIGTIAEPLIMTTSSRVGILAGYVSTSTAIIENITIKNSAINYTTSSTIIAYVGGVVGEFRATMNDIEVDQVEINLTSTSHANVKIGGVVGLLTETGVVNRVGTNANINFIMAGENNENQNILINIGGVIGTHKAINTNAVYDVFSKGNINVNLDFGTTDDTDDAYYAVYVGGVIGIAFSNFSSAFFGGSITLNHNSSQTGSANAFSIGGIVGFYRSNRKISQALRLGNGQTIDINIITGDVLLATQTIGENRTSAAQDVKIYGAKHLNINSVSEVDNDESLTITNLSEFFTSEWMKERVTNIN